MESGDQCAKKVEYTSPGLQLKKLSQQAQNFHGRLEWLWTSTSTNMKKRAGKERTLSKKFWHAILSACNAVVMLKIETRPGCTRTNSSGSAQEMNKKKKITSRLGQGLNFTVNVNFWFCN